MIDGYIITHIKSSDRKVSVEITDSNNNSEWLRMTVSMWKKFNLEAGAVLSEEIYNSVKNASTFSEALTKAARYLALASYSEKGLAQKLRRCGFSKSVSEKAAETMKNKGLIDEETQAINFAQNAYKKSLRGPVRIEYDLVAHGYPRAISKTAACLITKEQYDKALDIQLARKCPDGIFESEQKKNSAISSLIRLGFNTTDILKKIRALEMKNYE